MSNIIAHSYSTVVNDKHKHFANILINTIMIQKYKYIHFPIQGLYLKVIMVFKVLKVCMINSPRLITDHPNHRPIVPPNPDKRSTDLMM